MEDIKNKINILPLKDEYKNQIFDICYKTGYFGESLENRNIFEDKELFCYLFCFYYIKYEKNFSFVAIDKSGKILGYILGSKNNVELEITKKFGLRIFLMAIKDLLTQYKTTGKSLIYFLRNNKKSELSKEFLREYPAHLHINILPEAQRFGLGLRLLDAFEKNLVAKNIKGVYLITTSRNDKAINFYKKNGYEAIKVYNQKLWREVDSENIVFAKKL